MATQRNFLMQHFANPSGPLGSIVGDFMSTENHLLNLWAIEMLDIQETDNVLEIGFGPGTAIEELSERASGGYIAGIDYSELMFQQAKKLNIRAIKKRQVDLRCTSTDNLPDFGKLFDKILAVNNVMYWNNPVETLYNLRQQLRAGGHISLVLQRTSSCVDKGCDHIQDEIRWYAQCLQQAGFCNIQYFTQPIIKSENPPRHWRWTGLFNKPLALMYNVDSVSGICITATNFSILDILSEHAAQRRPYSISKRLFL